ncbi:MAG: hypothetical protein MHMPM18_004919, partial [Marteilia pararefringens]
IWFSNRRAKFRREEKELSVPNEKIFMNPTSGNSLGGDLCDMRDFNQVNNYTTNYSINHLGSMNNLNASNFSDIYEYQKQPANNLPYSDNESASRFSESFVRQYFAKDDPNCKLPHCSGNINSSESLEDSHHLNPIELSREPIGKNSFSNPIKSSNTPRSENSRLNEPILENQEIRNLSFDDPNLGAALFQPRFDYYESDYNNVCSQYYPNNHSSATNTFNDAIDLNSSDLSLFKNIYPQQDHWFY